MEPKKYQVEIVCRQRLLYQVEADDPAEAERAALQRWQNGNPSDLSGFDWCQLDSFRAEPVPDGRSQSQDDELLLRFIRERERLLADLLASTPNDAISAVQAAADLGWMRPAHGELASVDVVRAAHALERLCLAKKLVCFERPRARTGERGSIRLYCTPEYLERLSASMYDVHHTVGI